MTAITDDQKAEVEILGLANEMGKFALELSFVGTPEQQQALERLQVRRWITLADVAPVAAYPGRLFRVFVASDEALAWHASMTGHTN